MKALFDTVSIKCSKITTRSYSTSFSLGIQCFKKELRDPIYAIYGFVRFADEIVDSFHDYNKSQLLDRFREDTYRAIDERISLNPILNSFQQTVNYYKIDRSYIDLFLRSMEMDLAPRTYTEAELQEYILGSAEVVGLMCLQVFCKDNEPLFIKLQPHAKSLGAAFQKINFLRDLDADFSGMGRVYFPNLNVSQFDDQIKKEIESSIEKDFQDGYAGIKQLPHSARFGVYVAYVYYLALFRKIRNTPPEKVLKSRIRIKNRHKATLLAYSFFKHQLNML